MKQKIFSLLLLMAATTLGAWAADTYKIHLAYKLGNSNSKKDITGVDLTSQYTIPEADIIELIRNAAPEEKYKSYETITLGIFSVKGYPGSYPSVKLNNTNDDIVIEKSTEPIMNDYLQGTYEFNINFEAKETSSSVTEEVTTQSVLTVTVYHETHVADGTWVNTHATHHWQGCNTVYGKCELPDAATDPTDYPLFAAHTYGTDPTLPSYYTCSVCSHVENSRKPTHAHNYSSEWYYKGSSHTPADTEGNDLSDLEGKHWHYCTNTIGDCDAKRTDVANHEYGTSQEGTAYYTCKVCGYVNTTRQSEGHTHSYSSDWTKDDTNHWHVCTATTGACFEPIKDNAAHSYAAVDDPATATVDERYTCNICGYVDLARKAAIEANEANKNNPAWSWTYDIPFAFNATNVTNDRKLNALSANNKQQGYTVCLPYEITLPSTVEVYTLTASKNDQVGFVKTATNKLAPLTPYLIIPSISGQLLNAPDATIVETSQALVDANAVQSNAVSGQQKYALKGSISYKSGDVAASETTKSYYILQGENKWGKLTGGDYLNIDNPACILPLRAYLVTDGTAPARLFSIFDEATGISREIVVDADSTPVIYDLQGRKVTNPQRGGLYIINGKKMIMK